MECKWTREVCAKLIKQNAMVYPLVASMMSPLGWPDRYIAHTYWSGFLEFKGEITPIQAMQAAIIRGLKRRGVNVWVARKRGDAIHITDGEGNLQTVTDCTRMLRDLETLEKRLR